MATKRKVKRYADGSGLDDFEGVDRAIAANTDTGEWARGENYGDNTTGDERVAMARAPAREATDEEMRAAFEESKAKAPRAKPASKPAASKPAASTTKTETKTETKAKYETPYDRMNRQNREDAKTREDTMNESLRLARRAPATGRTLADQAARLSNDFRSSRLGRALTAFGFKEGGKVGSASKRADGIATRGKTRGKMV